jgi:hypothetical protein
MSANTFRRRTLAILVPLALASACATTHHLLAEYDFADRSLAVDPDLPPYPDVLTGPTSVTSRDPVRMVLDAATRAARELQVGDLEEKLDSAAARVDLHAVMKGETLRRASRYLGAAPEEDVPSADYVMQVTVTEYGISATDWDATAYFFMDAEAMLVDARTGDEIWRTQVAGRDPLGPEIFSGPSGARDVVTAAVLADLSVDDLARALEQLADFTARWVTDQLREDLRQSRRRE